MKKSLHEEQEVYAVEEPEDLDEAAEISFRRAVDAEGFARIAHHVTLDNRISDQAYRTYGLLLKYAQQKKKLFGGVDRLAKEREVTRQTISSHLKELITVGLITRERRFMKSSITYIEDVEQIYKTISATDVKETLPQSSNKPDDIIRIREEEKASSAASAERKKSDYQILMADLEKYFSEKTGIPIPERNAQGNVKSPAAANRTWYTPLNTLAKLFEHDGTKTKALILNAVTRMRRDELTIYAPQSIEKVAVSLFAANGGTAHKKVIVK